jgi:hypothetical protein
MCANLPLDDLPFKQNWPLLLLLLLSFLIHIFVNVKIKILTVKQKRSSNVPTYSDHLKFGDILSMENRSISDYMTSFLTVAAISFFLISINSENQAVFTKVSFFS